MDSSIALIIEPYTNDTPSDQHAEIPNDVSSKQKNAQKATAIRIAVDAQAKQPCKGVHVYAPASDQPGYLQLPAASSLSSAVEWCPVGEVQAPLAAQQWTQLAVHARNKRNVTFLLLVRGPYYFRTAACLQALQRQLVSTPNISCLVISPEQEPGAIAAIALWAAHLQVFGDQLFPPGVTGHDSLYFLYELYRRVGACGMADSIAVTSIEDGKAPGLVTCLSSNAQPCRWLEQLNAWGTILRGHLQRSRLAVDVCVPSYRVQYEALHKIISCPWDSSKADVRFVVQIDNPKHDPAQLVQLAQLREQMQHRLIIRMNRANLGRSGARNGCLEGSGAEYCVFFDDDVQPMQYCVNEYIDAFLQHPQERCFAGPTFMPIVPRPMPMAVHMSGVIDFWEVPHWYGEVIPWAITANVAYKNSDVRFRFPRTGGGEDVDYCLQLGARTIAVPRAQAVHPWWPGNRRKYYKRMFRWFEGDGMLIKMWPELSYVTAPSAIMCVIALAAAACVRLLPMLSFLACGLAVWLSDFLAEILRECCFKSRRWYTPGPFWMRPHAAVESALLKTVSEFGRLYGHIKVGKYGNVLRKFDWFCRYEPSFVATQRQFAAAKFAMFLASGIAAHALVCTALQQL